MSNSTPLNVKALLAPISDDHPAGLFDEDDSTYQAIDQEMVKLGGLHEGSLDWNFIDEASRTYLAQTCKHFRVAGYLITAHLRQPTWALWCDAVQLLAGMVSSYWESGYPKPGTPGHMLKRRQTEIALERLNDGLGKVSRKTFADVYQPLAEQALKQLQDDLAQRQVESAMLARLSGNFTRQIEEIKTPIQAEPAPRPNKGQKGGQAINEQFFASSGGLQLGNERESRRTLLTVADFVNQQDAYDPSGYELRRFALWSHIHSAPATSREQRTELMCVPADIADSYREALAANAIDPLLLQRVEKSVVSSPFWIRGSFLSATIAEKLEMPEVSTAILQATQRFVRRLPTLRDLRFSDNRPFIDDETLAWLTQAETVEVTSPTQSQEYSSLREELVDQLETEGVEVVLKRLQCLQVSYSSPRQRSYTSVIAADLLANRGLTWLAEDIYNNTKRLMESVPAQQWEPDLYEHLAQHSGVQWTIGQESKG